MHNAAHEENSVAITFLTYAVPICTSSGLALSRVRLVQPAVRHQPAPVDAHPVDLHTEAGGKADVRLRLAPRAQPLLGPRHVGPRSHVALASKPEPSVVQAVLLVRRSGRYAPPEAVRIVPEVRDGGVQWREVPRLQ